MPLSWNEIRHRAITFSNEWASATSESADKQTFWNEFFNVFGIQRKTFASFEVPVLKTSGNFGKIDLLWKGIVLVEHKSAGEDLDKAQTQAFDYIQGLATEGRQKDIPRYVIVSDFSRIVLHDLEPDEQKDLPLFAGRHVATLELPLAELHKHIHAFAFIPGYKQHKFIEQDPINIKAVQLLGDLHDALNAGGYQGHDLERFLVRILFCLFGEDTSIFERETFKLYLLNRTADDGADLGIHLARLFGVLNTPADKRQKNLDETLASFPYVNGDLFSENLGFADFDRSMRNALLKCTEFDWSRISPAVFGALFQGVMEPKERRQIGGHYTNERDILKVVHSLFLDDLRQEFATLKTDKSTRRQNRLEEFQKKLAGLRFFDPACGCGNFLVITYRELRQLETEVLLELHGKQHEMTLDDVNKLSQVDVDQFYGIEITEWPARIAEVALWLMDHQMNIRLSEAFGQYYVRLPLKKSPHIQVGNALRLDWRKVVPADKCSFILGNPPFVGHHFQTQPQKDDQHLVMANIQACGVLDYVTNWYVKAADYIQGTRVVVAFVSTNSISQGEQAGILWSELFGRYRLKIHFAHRTFAWESEARGKAHVHVVILGFAACDTPNKRIYDYDSGQDEPTVFAARNISPYLVEGADAVLSNRSEPICNVPAMRWGSKATDGGHFIFTEPERAEFLKREPRAEKWMAQYFCAEDYIHGQGRWCLWLKDISPRELGELPEVKQRVQAVRDFRAASKAEATRKYAKLPSLFRQIAQPDSDYLLIPRVSSERRPYIPIGFVSKDVIAGDVQLIADATLYHFGVLTSTMHMAWVRQFCGRLESRFRYSKDIVYNNYPWPATVTEKQRAVLDAAAQAVLDARAKFPTATLADLYDPLTMPADLLKAHQTLDRAVDRCYRPEPFASDRHRVEYLFALYEKLTAPPVAVAIPRRRKQRVKPL